MRMKTEKDILGVVLPNRVSGDPISRDHDVPRDSES